MERSLSVDEDGLRAILANYDIGVLRAFRTFDHGAGQTTLLLETSQRDVVLRLYENRSVGHVNSEVQLIAFLFGRGYPVPATIEDRAGGLVGIHRDKPYVLIEFVDGEHCLNPNTGVDASALSSIVGAVAHLHHLTAGAPLPFVSQRIPFDQDYCWQQFHRKHGLVVETSDNLRFKAAIDALEFPETLSKGICHADLNHGNFLLRGGTVAAVLDFDMSFYGYLVYDVASLIYWWAMPPNETVRTETAQWIVSEYRKHRTLLDVETAHILDALKLIVLLGIGWGDHSEVRAELDRVDQLNSLNLNFFT